MMASDLDYERAADEHRESPKPRARLAVIAIVAALAVAVWWLRSSWVPFSGNGRLSRSEVERIGQFRFPPGATDVLSNYVGLQDPTLQVRFSMPAGELDRFLADASLKRPLSFTEVPRDIDHPGPTKPWWQPGRPASFEAGEVTIPTGKAVHKSVLIDKSNPQVFTVWLVAYRPPPTG
jgi:hypothetical protein